MTVINSTMFSQNFKAESVDWVQKQLADLKKELGGDLTKISTKQIIELLKDVRAVNWSKADKSPENSAKYVFAIQAALHALDYGEQAGKIDAVFGDQTRNALKAFQQEMKLATDKGQLNTATIDKLIEKLDKTSISAESSVTSTICDNLMLGKTYLSKDEFIKNMQSIDSTADTNSIEKLITDLGLKFDLGPISRQQLEQGIKQYAASNAFQGRSTSNHLLNELMLGIIIPKKAENKAQTFAFTFEMAEKINSATEAILQGSKAVSAKSIINTILLASFQAQKDGKVLNRIGRGYLGRSDLYPYYAEHEEHFKGFFKNGINDEQLYYNDKLKRGHILGLVNKGVPIECVHVLLHDLVVKPQDSAIDLFKILNTNSGNTLILKGQDGELLDIPGDKLKKLIADLVFSFECRDDQYNYSLKKANKAAFMPIIENMGIAQTIKK
ncbi:peptidoglycan-binding protein [Candidatus Margulisiibacteriota bacterium]